MVMVSALPPLTISEIFHEALLPDYPGLQGYPVPEAHEAKQLGTMLSRYQNGQPARQTSGPPSVVIKSLEGGNLN